MKSETINISELVAYLQRHIPILETHNLDKLSPVARGQIQTDSRLVKRNDLFIAYKGTRSDGHDFIDACAIVSPSLIIFEDSTRFPTNGDQPCIRVDSAREVWSYAWA